MSYTSNDLVAQAKDDDSVFEPKTPAKDDDSVFEPKTPAKDDDSVFEPKTPAKDDDSVFEPKTPAKEIRTSDDSKAPAKTTSPSTEHFKKGYRETMKQTLVGMLPVPWLERKDEEFLEVLFELTKVRLGKFFRSVAEFSSIMELWVKEEVKKVYRNREEVNWFVLTKTLVGLTRAEEKVSRKVPQKFVLAGLEKEKKKMEDWRTRRTLEELARGFEACTLGNKRKLGT